MNIGMILDNVFPPDPRVENEAFTLINNGHTVYLFSLDYTHNHKEQEVINGIKVHRKRLPKHLYRFSALAYSFPYYHISLQRGIYKFIKNNDIEALHIHDIQAARSVFRVNKELNLPVVLDLHENRPEIMKYYPYVTKGLGRLLINPSRWKKFEYKYIKKASKVIVVTDEAKEHYLHNIPIQPEKVTVVPNFVRPDFYTDFESDHDIISKYKDRFVIIYIGDTGLRRGLETVINSLDILIQEIPNILLLFIGKSKTDSVLHELVEINNWGNYVEFTGWQDKSLFQSYLVSSHIGICPIHRNIHHDTTYANKLFQYMAFGKPVVVSNCIAQQNLVNKYRCGLVFQDRDVKDFSDKILTLYKDKDYYKELSENSLKAVKTSLNWEISGKGLVKLYDEL